MRPLLLSRAAARAVDEICAARFAIPTIVLMENAARALAYHTLARLHRSPARAAIIFVGKGNNGGDGLAAARHLHNARVPLRIISSHPLASFSGDALVQLRICRAMKLPISVATPRTARSLCAAAARALSGRPGVVLDALLGTGLSSPIAPDSTTGRLVEAMADLRAQRWPIISADVPSGLDCDTGRPLAVPPGRNVPRGTPPPEAPCVRADLTVSFVAIKRGYAHRGAKTYTGRVVVGDIGAPAAAIRLALARTKRRARV